MQLLPAWARNVPGSPNEGDRADLEESRLIWRIDRMIDGALQTHERRQAILAIVRG